MYDIDVIGTDSVPPTLSAELARLGRAVYPPLPPDAPPHPSHAIEWAGPELLAVVSAPGGRVVGMSGVLLRDVAVDGEVMSVCGIGSVQTDPELRNRGIARLAIAAGLRAGRERGARFGGLFCRDELLPLYERLGWTRFAGRIVAIQNGEAVTFTFNNAMTVALEGTVPRAEVIDLRGLPW